MSQILEGYFAEKVHYKECSLYRVLTVHTRNIPLFVLPFFDSTVSNPEN